MRAGAVGEEQHKGKGKKVGCAVRVRCRVGELARFEVWGTKAVELITRTLQSTEERAQAVGGEQQMQENGEDRTHRATATAGGVQAGVDRTEPSNWELLRACGERLPVGAVVALTAGDPRVLWANRNSGGKERAGRQEADGHGF